MGRERGLDIPAFNGDASFELPIPATYVVDTVGRILWQFVDTDYANRLETAIILDFPAERLAEEAGV